ncbi:hypothetical protein BC835DRAFT_1530513 [Cytidiella melzeri]|nr:hypothetical protein BC835DRAFT_1530513 [Cytidiella melzeri]
MHLSTSLILFASVVTGTFHMMTVFAIPYSSTGSRSLTLADNPASLEGAWSIGTENSSNPRQMHVTKRMAEHVSYGMMELPTKKKDREALLNFSANLRLERYQVHGPAQGASEKEWEYWRKWNRITNPAIKAQAVEASERGEVVYIYSMGEGNGKGRA